jgi:hypothetical protein
VGAAALAAALMLPVGCAAAPRTHVVAEAQGEVIAALPLGRGERFSLTYRHSVLHAPAREEFTAAPDGSFRLTAVVSPDEAVLDYYAVPGERTWDEGRWRLDLADPPAFRELPLIATARGGRTLVAGQRRAALTDGPAREVVLRLRRP